MSRPCLHSIFFAAAALFLPAGLAGADLPDLQTHLTGLEAPLPGAGASLLRVLGALVAVLALFGLGVWLVRHSSRFGIRWGLPARLRVIEARSLNYRHSLYVIGYDQQRFLVGVSPGNIALLTQLPPAEKADAAAEPPASGFTGALRQAFHRKP